MGQRQQGDLTVQHEIFIHSFVVLWSRIRTGPEINCLSVIGYPGLAPDPKLLWKQSSAPLQATYALQNKHTFVKLSDFYEFILLIISFFSIGTSRGKEKGIVKL